MMFLQFFVAGATIPVMSLYLKGHLHFSGGQAGLILSMNALAAFVSPVVGVFIADRFISAEKMLSLCHLGASVLMFVLTLQHNFTNVLAVYLAYVLVAGPTVALANAVAFHHIPEAQRDFGGVRMWGTIGWVAVAWFLSFFWLSGAAADQMASRLPDALKLSAISSFVFSIYALSLPKSFAASKRSKKLMPVESFRVLIQPKIVLIGLLAFLMSITNKYYYFGMGPFLDQFGVKEGFIMPLMSLGQITEIFAMLFLGICLKRLGFKMVLILGVFTQVWRFAALAISGSLGIISSGIVFHGINFAFFMTASLIYIDSQCDKNSRTGVHQLLTILNMGFGSLVGNLMAGRAIDIFTSASGVINFRAYWTVPLVITVVCLVATLMFIPREDVEPKIQIELNEV
jgi:nucleoside transporter